MKKLIMDGLSSLPVPRVQALAASLSGTGEIPRRYIRPEVEAEPVADDANVELPVIDLLQGQISQDEFAKIGLACEEWGFFQLINHGVPEELIEKMKVNVAEFFKLPLEEKETFAQLPNGSEGYGQLFVKSEEQKLDWADLMMIITQPHSSRNMRFWPPNPSTLRDTMDKYSSALKEVAGCLLKMMAENLGLDTEVITNTFKEIHQRVRINYYPPCPKAEKVIGISPHSDASALTILLQASDVQGLQIRKNGRWLPVKPLPGAFIVNVGDTLEILTNGKYKSVEHRAVVNSEKERLSIATYHMPPLDSTVGPLPVLVKGGRENYRTSTFEDYMKSYFSAKLDGKNHLESLKLRN